LNLKVLFCSGSDNGGRYTYANQPAICEWNLQKLAEALHPALPLAKSKPIVERIYKKQFKTYYLEKMRKKVINIKFFLILLYQVIFDRIFF